MKNAVYNVDLEKILSKTFSFLVECGLESVTIRDLCRGTGLVQGSLYYWFGDKNAIICESAEYGLQKVTDEIFKYVFDSINDLPRFFSECLDHFAKYKKELRFVYQMAASPIYGKKIRKDGKYFKQMYNEYAQRLAEILNCDVEEIRPIVYLFISAICDFAIWEDKENAQTELDYIYSVLPKKFIES